jgi:hypothetical protein
MSAAKNCFETGLFLMGTAWGDRNTKPQQHLIVTKQATSALKDLGIDPKFVEDSIPPASVSDNVNSRLQWVSNAIDSLQRELKPLIEKQYGTKGSYCYQVGVDLGNLMFASGILDSSIITPAQIDNLKFLHPFLDNLKLSSIGIGNPPMLEEFIKDVANIFASPLHVGTKMERIVSGFLEGVPYIGKGLAELYRAWKGRKRKDIHALSGVPAKATTCAQQLVVWIDINISIQLKKPKG